ncbi:MAG: hypothetical protein V1907_00225 [Candidatus Kerfeldbacteria bacterium]
MGEKLNPEPNPGVSRKKDEDFLSTINAEFEKGDTAKNDRERYSEEIDVLCHRYSDLVRMRNEIEASKGKAMTYLDTLSLPDESRREQDILELSRRSERIVDDAINHLTTHYKILNILLLETPDDARRSLINLTAEDVRSASDELLSRYKDMQDLHEQIVKAVNQYRDLAQQASRKQ